MSRTHITFTVNAPARFELMVEPNGSVVLFGYEGINIQQEQEPDLVFDTDGSFCALGPFDMVRIHK